jgi:hypothetical protein
MELAWLKNRQNQGGGGPPEEILRESDSGSERRILETITDELMEAFHRKDHKAFLEALHAFVLMVQHIDEVQDAADEG